MSKSEVVIDLTAANAVLSDLGGRLSNPAPLMREWGEILIRSTRERFKKGVDPEGNPWAPNTEATLARKRGSKPLIGKTRLLSQAVAYEVQPDGLAWGSNLIYAAVQQLGAGKGVFGAMANGSPIPWGTIPARPFLGVSDQDRSDMVLAAELFFGQD